MSEYERTCAKMISDSLQNIADAIYDLAKANREISEKQIEADKEIADTTMFNIGTRVPGVPPKTSKPTLSSLEDQFSEIEMELAAEEAAEKAADDEFSDEEIQEALGNAADEGKNQADAEWLKDANE